MKTGEAGIALIKEFEGCHLTAYLCPAGVWTIGYGHTQGVHKGQHITQDQADAFLHDDLSTFEQEVSRLLGSAPTTQNRFDAMVSLTYNIGGGAFARSSVLRLHKAGHYDQAAEAFIMWTRAGHRVLPGLVRRRAAERALYETP